MRLETFDNDELNISGVVPAGWTQQRPGVVARQASPADPTILFQRGFTGAAIEELKMGVPSILGLDTFPPHVGTRETELLTWNLYADAREAPKIGSMRVDIALAQAGGCSFAVGLVAPASEYETLHWEVIQHGENEPSKVFWENVIQEYTRGNFRKAKAQTEWWEGQALIFDNSSEVF